MYHTGYQKYWQKRIFIMSGGYISWRITANLWIIFRSYWQYKSEIWASVTKRYTNPPCSWPPRSKVVKVMPAIVSSSEAGERNKISFFNRIFNHIIGFVYVCDSNSGSLGCKVGTCCPNLSSLSMCSNVVLPALSRPRNTNLPDFLYSPETKPESNQV